MTAWQWIMIMNYKCRTGSCMEGWGKSRIIFFVISNGLALITTDNLQNRKTFLGVKGGRRVRLTTPPSSVSRLSRQCGILDISQTYRPPRPVEGVAFFNYKNVNIIKHLIKPIYIYIYIYIRNFTFYFYPLQHVSCFQWTVHSPPTTWPRQRVLLATRRWITQGPRFYQPSF
jgi:hypothetical protein